MSPAKQANRAGRPWQRKDGRWAARAYPPDGSRPRMVYGATEAEVTGRQHDIETGPAPNGAPEPEPESVNQQEYIDPAPNGAPELPTAVGSLPPRPPKPVRITVDLSPDEHLALRRYATEHGTTGTRVIRALLAELADGGPDLDARVRARLWAAK